MPKPRTPTFFTQLPTNQLISGHHAGYTEDAGLEISIDLTIASPFSGQIAIGNAGTILALESMGAKPTFRCHILNIGPLRYVVKYIVRNMPTSLLKLHCYCPMLLMRTTKTAVCLQTKAIFHHLYVFELVF